MIFRQNNRRLLTNDCIYSGETASLSIMGGVPDANPGDCSVILFDRQKEILAASGTFTQKWETSINTATRPMVEFFSGVTGNATKTVGLLVIDNSGSAKLGGQVTIVSAPFPADIVPLDPAITDPVIRLSDLSKFIVAGENVTIDTLVDGSVKVNAAGGGTGTGISPEVALAFRTAIQDARSIAAIKTAVIDFCNNYIME